MTTNNTFIWANFDSWHIPILKALSDVIDPKCIEHFKSNPPKYISSDNLVWLENIIEKVKGNKINIVSLLADRLINNYKSLRSFHACCPKEPTQYYEKGLIPLNFIEHNQFAFNHFLTSSFPEITEEHLTKAIKQMQSPFREGKVFFELNDKLLPEDCGHYLLYGSEYLIGIAAALNSNPGDRDYRNTFKLAPSAGF